MEPSDPLAYASPETIQRVRWRVPHTLLVIGLVELSGWALMFALQEHFWNGPDLPAWIGVLMLALIFAPAIALLYVGVRYLIQLFER